MDLCCVVNYGLFLVFISDDVVCGLNMRRYFEIILNKVVSFFDNFVFLSIVWVSVEFFRFDGFCMWL